MIAPVWFRETDDALTLGTDPGQVTLTKIVDLQSGADYSVSGAPFVLSNRANGQYLFEAQGLLPQYVKGVLFTLTLVDDPSIKFEGLFESPFTTAEAVRDVDNTNPPVPGSLGRAIATGATFYASDFISTSGTQWPAADPSNPPIELSFIPPLADDEYVTIYAIDVRNNDFLTLGYYSSPTTFPPAGFDDGSFSGTVSTEFCLDLTSDFTQAHDIHIKFNSGDAAGLELDVSYPTGTRDAVIKKDGTIVMWRGTAINSPTAKVLLADGVHGGAASSLTLGDTNVEAMLDAAAQHALDAGNKATAAELAANQAKAAAKQAFTMALVNAVSPDNWDGSQPTPVQIAWTGTGTGEVCFCEFGLGGSGRTLFYYDFGTGSITPDGTFAGGPWSAQGALALDNSNAATITVPGTLTLTVKDSNGLSRTYSWHLTTVASWMTTVLLNDGTVAIVDSGVNATPSGSTSMAVGGGGATPEAIAAAVRDVDNTAPAVNSLGARINETATAMNLSDMTAILRQTLAERFYECGSWDGTQSDVVSVSFSGVFDTGGYITLHAWNILQGGVAPINLGTLNSSNVWSKAAWTTLWYHLLGLEIYNVLTPGDLTITVNHATWGVVPRTITIPIPRYADVNYQFPPADGGEPIMYGRTKVAPRSVGEIAEAVRDVDNSAPAAGSLGEAVNNSGLTPEQTRQLAAAANKHFLGAANWAPTGFSVTFDGSFGAGGYVDLYVEGAESWTIGRYASGVWTPDPSFVSVVTGLVYIDATEITTAGTLSISNPSGGESHEPILIPLSANSPGYHYGPVFNDGGGIGYYASLLGTARNTIPPTDVNVELDPADIQEISDNVAAAVGDEVAVGVWTTPVPASFPPASAGYTQGKLIEITTKFNEMIAQLLSHTYNVGQIDSPYSELPGPTLSMFYKTNYIGTTKVGEKWGTILSTPGVKVFFSAKMRSSDTTSAIDVECEITDSVTGRITIRLTKEQLTVKATEYFWQLQARTYETVGDPPVTIVDEVWMMQEGKLLVKPTFKG